MKTMDLASLGFGVLAFLGLLGAYFGILTLVSGWSFTLDQFFDFWYFIVPLGAGFGTQVRSVCSRISSRCSGGITAEATWKGGPSGGHHRKGVLQFAPVPGNTKSLELRITGAATPEARVFAWKLR